MRGDYQINTVSRFCGARVGLSPWGAMYYSFYECTLRAKVTSQWWMILCLTHPLVNANKAPASYVLLKPLSSKNPL